MTEIGTNERLLCSDVTQEESKQIERVLRQNNISYFEKWNTGSGFFGLFSKKRNNKCDIYIHMDSYDKAVEILGIQKKKPKKNK